MTTLAHCAEHNLPDLEHFITNTADLDEDVLKIHRRDSSTTLYIVGVYSISIYSAFQLSFGYESSILELQAGVAVTDHVFDKEYDYFAFYMDQPRKVLKITLSPVRVCASLMGCFIADPFALGMCLCVSMSIYL